MPPAMFALLFTVVLLLFASISVILLVRPSLYMRRYPNPWMQDTPWTRIQMRAVGLVFFLFVLMVLLGIFSSSSKSGFLKGFSDNILAALWLAFISAWFGGVLAWVVWRFAAVRIAIRRRYSSEKLEDPAWERRMTVTFCALLLLIVASAFLLAAESYHPPQLSGN